MMRIPIVELRVERSCSAECFREQVLTAEKAAEWMGGIIGDSCREHVAIVCFDASMRATCIDIVSRGSANMSPCYIPEVFKAAIASNATCIMMFHNHPSGDAQPSQSDAEVKKRVRKAGEILGVELVDHIVIGSGGRYYSFKEQGGL